VRLRLSSPSPDCRCSGFLTVTSWEVDVDNRNSDTFTPTHQSTKQVIMQNCQQKHRRSQSLPPSVAQRSSILSQPHLALLHSNPVVATYRFHSGLGGDISVQETLLEHNICFAFPQQLLSMWIAEEKELVHEIAGLGELKAPWHNCQMTWLENHLNIINIYSTALENMDNYRGVNFKQSSKKGEIAYEFIPTNLHLQRMWVQNLSLRKSAFYDIHTVGAFTAYAQKTRSQGLIKMLKELKAPQPDSRVWCQHSDRLQMVEDALANVRKVRREVVDCMRLLMKLAKMKEPDGMFVIVEEMLKKTKLLCSISDIVMIEHAFHFLEENRIAAQRPDKDEFSDSVAEFMQRNKLKIDLPLFRPNFNSLQTPCTEFVSTELRTPDYMSPSFDPSKGEYWKGYSAFTSGYQSVDRLSDIDEFEESFKSMSVLDKTRHYYTLCRNDTPSSSPQSTPRHGESSAKKSSSPSSPQSTPTHEESSEKQEIVEDLSEDKLDSREDADAPEEDSACQENDLNSDQCCDSENDFSEDDMFQKEDGDEDDDDESTPQIGSINSKNESPSSSSNPSIKMINQNSNLEEESQSVENLVCQDEEEEEKQENLVSQDEQQEEKQHPIKLEITESEEVEPIPETEEDNSNKNAIEAAVSDQGIVSDNDSSPHYRSGDEPEPIDLTHLNIEAAMMCLASKVRSISGKTNSPTLGTRTFRFKELDAMKRKNQSKAFLEKTQSVPIPLENTDISSNVPETESEDVSKVQKDMNNENKELDKDTSSFNIPNISRGSRDTGDMEDWAGQVRPSMRKLRQGMDSLLKTSRLMCSVLRLQQQKAAVDLTHRIKYRRDVCFSQALTSLVSSLMSRLWCSEPDFSFISTLTKLGPLVLFEGLLSMHGEDITIFNDMIVVVEDLRSVEFTLILAECKSKGKSSRKVGHGHINNGDLPMITYSKTSFPLPRITGSRSSMKVMLPIPDWVYTMIPLQDMKTVCFTVTPVFFNVGINEHATLAYKLGLNDPQYKNNSDNLRILGDYIRRYNKLQLYSTRTKSSRKETNVEDLLSILKNEVSRKINKNVSILGLSQQICHQLEGIKFTSCKSGKDRTGMSVTLQQVNILSREYDLAESEYQKALDTMRSEGTRIENCRKNIGSRKFAFKTLQLATFPAQYKPPLGTYGAKTT